MSTKTLKQILTLACASIFALTATAATLTPEQALSRALPSVKKVVSNAEQFSLAYTENIVASETPAVYVFSRENQFLVLSADDRAEAILGYADGAFDPNNMPPAFKWWMGEYARQMEASPEAIRQAPLRASREAVAPLLTTKWDQSTPYNNLCPTFSGEIAKTGCIATAMAQVLNHHQWPDVGTGTLSYRQGLKKIEFDYSNTPFDWANMLDRYTANATEEQNTAVATLMFATGVSVKMQYGADASGSYDYLITNALVTYFKYDPGVRWLSRDHHTSAEWEEVIYSNLAANQPVIYNGISQEGGHSFVCDGYNTDGYFHINWGWGGLSDGYFRLMALDPDAQGIGGSLSGYNFNQSAIVGIKKLVEGQESEVLPNLILTEDFVMPETAESGSYVVVGVHARNYSHLTAKGSLGLVLTNTESGEVTKQLGPNMGSGLPSGYQSTEYEQKIPVKIGGSFIVEPAYINEEDEWFILKGKPNGVSKYLATVEAGTYTFTPIREGSISIDSFTLNTDIYLDNMFNITGKISNTGTVEYKAVIAPALINAENKIVAFGQNIAILAAEGETIDFEYTGKMSNYPTGTAPEVGTYNMCFIDAVTHQPLSETVEVELMSEKSPKFSITKLSMEGDTNNADATNLQFTARVRCSRGYFGGFLDLVIFPDATDEVYAVASFRGNAMFLSANESADFAAGGPFPEAVVGEKYFAAIFNDYSQLGLDVLWFTIGSNNFGAVDVVETDQFMAVPNPSNTAIVFTENALMANVYNMSGVLVRSVKNTSSVDIESLPAGIYILQATPENAADKSITRRFVKK